VIASYFALFAISCSDPKSSSEEVSVLRVNAVKGNRTERDYQKWCDRVFAQSEAPKLALPAAEPAGKQTTVATLPPQRWVWVNLWATWCKPCIREMPMLQLWQQQLAKFGQSFDLWFVSVDQDKAELEHYLTEHPDLASRYTLRLTNAQAMEPWLKTFNLDSMASVPIQIIVAPGGGVRCVRTGALNDGDFSIVKNLIR
jgi:thiol-disulfide isomerase/thioredoxin